MSPKPGLQQSEVGLIPDNWNVSGLAAISERIMVGIASAATHAYRPRGVPLLRNQNIKAGFLDDRDLLFVDGGYEETFRSKRLRAGDLLTARTGYPGLTCVVPIAYEGAQSFTTLITRPKAKVVDSSFLCQFLNSEIGQAFFERSQIGGAQKNVNAGTLRGMPVPVPPLPEQQAIAAALSDVDSLLGAINRLLVKKRDLKQAVMQQLLTGRTRLPSFSGKWEAKRLGDLTDCTSGGTPSTAVPSYWGGSIRWMNSGDLNLKFVNEVDGRITEAGLISSSAKMIPRDCVLVGLAGQGKTRGTTAINRVELCTNQSIAAILPCQALDPNYLYYNLDSRYDELRKISAGDAGRGGLNLTLIRSLQVPAPELREQRAIAAALLDIDSEIDALEQRREKTRLLKQGMMQELLTGRTRLV